MNNLFDNKSFYDKYLILVDLNFYKFDSLYLDDIISIRNTIKEISSAQNLLLISDTDINFCLKIIEDWGLNSGYIISNSGSCIYNIFNKTLINTNALKKNIILDILKQAVWKNINFIINTEKNGSFIYQLNPWIVDQYQEYEKNKIFFLEKSVINYWSNLVEIIKNNEILSIEFLFNNEGISKINDFLKNISYYDAFNHFISKDSLFIFSQQSSRLIAINKIASDKNINIHKNAIYLAIDQYTKQLIEKCYLNVINSDLLILLNENLEEIHDIIPSNLFWTKWLYKQSHLWSYKFKEILKKEITISDNNSKKLIQNLLNNTEEIKAIKINNNKILLWEYQIKLLMSLLNSKN